MQLHIKYRVDKRMKVVEITTGNKKFLAGLMDFMFETGIGEDTLDDANRGETDISLETYKTLWGDRIQ